MTAQQLPRSVQREKWGTDMHLAQLDNDIDALELGQNANAEAITAAVSAIRATMWKMTTVIVAAAGVVVGILGLLLKN